MKHQVIPTVLVKSLPEFKKRLKQIQPYFSFFSLDVADGEFVPNVTYNNPKAIDKVCSRCGKTNELDYDVHLMVVNPRRKVNRWLKDKKCRRVIFHLEACVNNGVALDVIKTIKKAKKQIGLAINPITGIEKISPFADKIDLILLLGVEPGFSGQKYHRKVTEKARRGRNLFPKIDIGIDGGVKAENMSSMIKAGANVFYMGSYLNKDIAARKEKIQKIIKKYI